MGAGIINTHRSRTMNNLSRRSAGKSGVKYIVIHYTGNGDPYGNTARNCCIYFNREHVGASADFFIDNSGTYRYNPNCEKYYSWHCGDGHGRYGITNRNSIGIEVCQDGDRDYTKTEKKRLKKLVRSLCKKYRVPESHVVRHYDASRKMCPYYYAKRPKKWEQLKNYLFS